MAENTRIKDVDISGSRFKNSFKKLPIEIKKEAAQALAALKSDFHPAKLHFHKLNGYDIYTIHLCASSKYKASFTIENGIAVMRYAGLHDSVDGNP